jgi:hypothetical protein
VPEALERCGIKMVVREGSPKRWHSTLAETLLS